MENVVNRNLNRRDFLKTAGLTAAALAVPGCDGASVPILGGAKVAKPNFVIVFCDDAGYADVGVFGAEGYEDFTQHKDPERRERYLTRHRSRENWTKSGIDTAGFWSKHILWNKPTLSGSIRDTERKFGIKIRRNK